MRADEMVWQPRSSVRLQRDNLERAFLVEHQLHGKSVHATQQNSTATQRWQQQSEWPQTHRREPRRLHAIDVLLFASVLTCRRSGSGARRVDTSARPAASARST